MSQAETPPTARAVRPFVPCDDFELCKRFYADIGFTQVHADAAIAVFACGTAGFFLQNYRWPGAGENYMVQLTVEDVDAWWRRIEAVDLADYGARASAPADQPWGDRVLYLHDPTGILWHISQRL